MKAEMVGDALWYLREYMAAGWHPLYTVDALGMPVLPDDEGAKRWSMCDALCVCSTIDAQIAAEEILQSLIGAVPLPDWLAAPGRTQAEVVALVNRGLLRARALEADGKPCLAPPGTVLQRVGWTGWKPTEEDASHG